MCIMTGQTDLNMNLFSDTVRQLFSWIIFFFFFFCLGYCNKFVGIENYFRT